MAEITGKANRRAAGILCDFARWLYLAGLSSVNKAKRELVAGSPEWEAKRAKRDRKAREQVDYVTKVRKAKPIKWTRHPVTGWPMQVPAGKDVRDLIPYGRDPVALKRVAKHYDTHARIGAANVLTYLESEGINPAQYRTGLLSRRHEAGPHKYSYGPRAIDPAVVLEIDHGRTRSVPAGEQVSA